MLLRINQQCQITLSLLYFQSWTCLQPLLLQNFVHAVTWSQPRSNTYCKDRQKILARHYGFSSHPKLQINCTVMNLVLAILHEPNRLIIVYHVFGNIKVCRPNDSCNVIDCRLEGRLWREENFWECQNPFASKDWWSWDIEIWYQGFDCRACSDWRSKCIIWFGQCPQGELHIIVLISVEWGYHEVAEPYFCTHFKIWQSSTCRRAIFPWQAYYPIKFRNKSVNLLGSAWAWTGGWNKTTCMAVKVWKPLYNLYSIESLFLLEYDLFGNSRAMSKPEDCGCRYWDLH